MSIYRRRGQLALAFALGLTVSCFFSQRFVVLLVTVCMLMLAVALMKC